MLVKIFYNTEGYLGAWSVSAYHSPSDPDVYDIPGKDIPLFHGAIASRPEVEVVFSRERFDVEFGNLKLKFHKDQDKKLIKKTKEAHKLNNNKSHLEESLFT